MLNDIESIYAVIWAAVIGIAFAVVYTNISRAAISKFINFLIDNNSDSESAALMPSKMGLGRLYARIIQRAVKSNNGLKRVIHCSKVAVAEPSDEAELLLYGNKKQYCYWLKDDIDVNELRKKYNYKPISIPKLILMLICVILTAVIMTKAAELFDGYLTSKRLSENENAQQDENASDDNKLPDDVVIDSTKTNIEENDVSDDESDTEQKNDSQSDDSTGESSPARPSIPMGPTT